MLYAHAFWYHDKLLLVLVIAMVGAILLVIVIGILHLRDLGILVQY